jgi:transposase-like protein
MRKQTISEEKCCPHCGQVKGQTKQGLNRSGTQRCKCLKCGKKYTLNPKTNTYSEEIREQAVKTYFSGVSARGVGKIFGMSKANVLNWIKKNEGDNME